MSVKYTVYKPHVHGTAPPRWRVVLCTLRGVYPVEEAGTRLECTKAVALATYGSLLYPTGTWADALTRIFRPQDCMYHCELMFSLPCTWNGTGGSCAAPFGHVRGRVRPYHVLVVQCYLPGKGEAVAGICVKELPTQANSGAWMYHRIDVSAAERHRMLMYCLAFVGSRYREFKEDLSYAWTLPAETQGRLQIWYGSVIGSLGPGFYTFPETEARARRLRKEYREAATDDPFASEARLTSILMRELADVLPPLAGRGSVKRHVAEVARRLAAYEQQVRKARPSAGPYRSPETPQLPEQTHVFTCIELTLNALMFAGVLTRTGGCPTNRTVASLYPCLEREERIGRSADSTLMQEEHLSGRHVLATGRHVYFARQNDEDEEGEEGGGDEKESKDAGMQPHIGISLHTEYD